MDAYQLADRLPPIDVLRGRCLSLAVLERILGGEFRFDPAWGEDQAALMENGSGDEWSVVFTGAGCFIRVFDHESEMSPFRDGLMELWPGLADGLPEVFREQFEEPAFAADDGTPAATALLWRLSGDERWSAAPGLVFPELTGPWVHSPDGTDQLEVLLDDMVATYVEYARDYFEVEVDPSAVEAVVGLRPITDDLVSAVSADADAADVRAYALEIGYPV